MEGSADEVTRDLRAWSVRLEPGQAGPFLERMSEKARAEGADFLMASADQVFGKDHLRAALYHAKRAIAEGTNASDSLAMETLLYASGERQLNAAIRKMTVGDATTEIVVAVLQGRLDPMKGWSELPEVSSGPSKERLIKFGITEEEILSFDGPPVELVLEKVAAVDILKK